MQIASCRTYHGKTVGRTMLRMPDRRSVFKVYYISVVGRDTPEAFEWSRSPCSVADFERAFLAGGYEGIGFILAFPHVTKIFRFSPGAETILDVRAFHTDGMRPLDCARGEGYHEFACYAEAVIAADEYRAWAEAETVERYLDGGSEAADFPVTNNAKLAVYWAGK